MRILALTVLTVIVVLLAACSSSQPQINLEINKFDFGDVVNGVIMEKDLQVHNTGMANLIVETVTTASLDSMTILAGESATLHIEFDSGAHGPELTGQLTRQVILVSNDLQRPEATIEFAANILPPEIP